MSSAPAAVKAEISPNECPANTETPRSEPTVAAHDAREAQKITG